MAHITLDNMVIEYSRRKYEEVSGYLSITRQEKDLKKKKQRKSRLSRNQEKYGGNKINI